MEIATAPSAEGITTNVPASEAPAVGPSQGADLADLAEATQGFEITKKPNGNQRAVEGGDDDIASDASSALSTEAWRSGTFESDLLNALDNVQTQGSFASFHPLKRVDPNLFVHDVGPIVLPLQEPQIRQIIDKAIQAPFGKGSETIVDTKVRNTWELDPKHFELLSPRWRTDLHRICAIVAGDMGIRSSVTAELYKLLVYEKGAMFKVHTDSEKCPGMFGTLVICLPSPHEGGDVVVKHAGLTKTFKTSAVDQSFACWYSDVQHEVLPVTHGYRVVLTYNLTIDQAAERPSAGLLRSETRMLRHTLMRWLCTGAGSEEVSHVYYGLDHEYTEANISLKALKGRDLAVVQTLQELASELEFDVLLALTEKMEMGSAEPHGYDPRYDTYRPSRRQLEEDEMAPHEIDEVYDTELTVKVLVDLSGRPIIRDIALEQDSCLQADGFFEGVSRKEEFEGFTGNSGATATHWYCVTAALIIRRDRINQFLAESAVAGSYRSAASTKLLLDYLADSILKDARNKESAFNTLKDIWTRASALTGAARWEMDINTIGKMLRASIRMERWEFFESMAENIRVNLPFEYYTWLREQVSEGKVLFDKVKTGLASNVLGDRLFFHICTALESFAPADQPLTEEFRQWVRETLVRGLTASAESACLTCHDGTSIVASAKKYAYFDWLSSVAMPLIEDQFITPAFTTEFLATLFSYAVKNYFSAKEALGLYKRVAKGFVEKLNFSRIHGTKTEEQTPKAPRHSYGQTTPESNTVAYNNLAVTPAALASLFYGLIKLSRPPHDDPVMPLAMKLVSFSPKMRSADFDPLWIPFLQQLITVLEELNIPFTTPRYQQIFGAVLESYRDNYVGQKPVTQISSLHGGMHVHARSRCACLNCHRLNRFLENPGEYVCRFSVNKKTRYHLHQEIERNRIQCSHETERNWPTETLVVTKLREKEERKYAERQKRAAERFQEFDQTKLGLLLGGDYPAIAQGLWKRPVNLASERGGSTHTLAAGPPQPGTMPGLRPTAAIPAVSSLANVPVSGSFNAFTTAPGIALDGVVSPTNPSCLSQPLPSCGTTTLMTGAAAPPPQPTPFPSRVSKRKAESEIIDLT
ncbi:2OG-Fe(II) oxygenase superfamily protein [Colletotrichum graminicola M1.001]|uniref:2OG-Fe(II) oxygenase superfamily protein n=1 Tax=Colletotrichum graminicola (strain M1.001 / M2 / FGSC 10212) TaxID=645133 RepID=E3Q7A2_COLGM|nr:2OG-Fe(II) oxygenase superfamily protein [Colletotrichum graminicola M1.001]EFQ26740.1 2OG-Fe(II) oxygenase superfamily protein [Colletotrichum graminicola M1.001]